MKNNTTSSQRETNRVLEFMTILGVSILFTLAGMHYIKSAVGETSEKIDTEIPIAVVEKPTANTSSVSLSLIVEKLLP